MCNKCGQAYISPYVSKRTIARRQKEQDYLMMGLSITDSLFNVLGQVIPSKDDDNDYNYTPRTKVEESKESEEEKPIDTTKLQEEVEGILGKENFNKLSADLQKDILNKYNAYQNVLKLEGEPLSNRLKNYVKALKAHQVELKMGAYNEKLFEETLKEVAVNPENPTEEELEQVKTKVLQKKQECDIKIEDSDIETQALQNDQNFEKHLLAVKARGQGYVDMYDKNNNGVISFEEFKALEELDSVNVLSPEETEATRIFFNRIDKDNDGIEAHEMASHLYAMSRMHDKSEEGAPNSANDITFGEWLDSQQILNNENVSTRYNSIYNMLYEEIKPKK